MQLAVCSHMVSQQGKLSASRQVAHCSRAEIISWLASLVHIVPHSQVGQGEQAKQLDGEAQQLYIRRKALSCGSRRTVVQQDDHSICIAAYEQQGMQVGGCRLQLEGAVQLVGAWLTTFKRGL